MSVVEPAAGGGMPPRGLLQVGGSSVLRHQLGLALAADCRRIVCISSGLSQALVALQHVAENMGAQFHVISGASQLSGLVTATDEVLAISDGLLVAPLPAIALLDRPAVLVQPVETGVEAGFERLDINNATAGVMLVPGRLVARLAELPVDCDVISALTRIAIQSGISLRQVPAAMRSGAGWSLVRDEPTADDLEPAWIALHSGDPTVRTPGPIAARLVVGRFGPALLHAGSAGAGLAIAAAALLTLALVAGWFGYTATGLILAGLGWLGRVVARLLSRIERDSLQLPAARVPGRSIYAWATDFVLVLIVVWSRAHASWPDAAAHAFAPLMLVFFLRLVPKWLDAQWTRWCNDRLVVALLLAFAAAGDLLVPGIQLAALVVAVGALAGSRAAGPQAHITRA